MREVDSRRFDVDASAGNGLIKPTVLDVQTPGGFHIARAVERMRALDPSKPETIQDAIRREMGLSPLLSFK